MPERAREAPSSEAALARRWEAGVRGALRLEDGRSLRVIFPGVPGGGAGPDFRGAILDAGGDYLRGDVELHLVASGWRAHGHDTDPAYGNVVLHVVEANDGTAPVTLHRSGRAIPVLVLRSQERGAFPPPFAPPCSFATAAGLDVAHVLAGMGERRLRIKAARVSPPVASDGAGQAFYTLMLETLAGPANRGSFAALARGLPLAALLERASEGHRSTPDRGLALTAELRGAAAGLALRRAGLRPAANPARRIESAARLVARLWPEGAAAELPAFPGEAKPLLKALQVEGVGRGMAIEVAVNAVLPLLDEDVAAGLLRSLPSPGTYGKLRSLEGWLGKDGRPFAGAAALQGGLLMHAEYCTRGMCGRCPLSQ